MGASVPIFLFKLFSLILEKSSQKIFYSQQKVLFLYNKLKLIQNGNN